MIIKLKIKEVREKKNISIDYLVEDTGIEKDRLLDIENNKIDVDKVSLAEMIVLSDSLDVSILELYEITNIKIQ